MRRSLKVTAFYAIAAGLTMAAAALASTPTPAANSAAEPADFSNLTPGPGRELLNRSCLQCHGTGIVTQQRLSAKTWTAEVKKMVKFGASLSDADQSILADYLARILPPKKPAEPFPRVPVQSDS